MLLILQVSISPSRSVAPVRFGSGTVPAWDGSNDSGFRFGRSLQGKHFSVVLHCLTEEHSSDFGSRKTAPTVPVLRKGGTETHDHTSKFVPSRFG